MKTEELTRQTISDFGEQWTSFTANTGYYGSVDLFLDIVGDLLPPAELKDKNVADIGSGTGRIVRMLVDAGAKHVTAVEPSAAFDVLTQNTREIRSKVTLLNIRGDELPPTPPYDYIFSLGVIHHIPDPDPVIAACYAALNPNGKIILWLYGHEGNYAYLALARPLRALTPHLPHSVLKGISYLLSFCAVPYGFICGLMRFLPLSMYFVNHFNKLAYTDKVLTIYDQLNPSYAKYYTKPEALDLLTRNNFKNCRLFHRHGYSWTIIGEK